jgi:hypothetical protein
MNRIKMIRANTIFLAAACVPLCAQVEAPLFGYLPDGARLRPVYGIPASAAIGAAADYGRDFSGIAVSSRQDFAIVSAADSGAVFVASPAGALTAISDADPSPDRIFLSPRGSAALLWFSATGRLQVITGLPGAPAVRSADASFLNVAPHALAVSDDGQWFAGAFSEDVWLFGPQGQATPLRLGEQAYSLAFFGGRSDLAVATAAHIFSITDVGGAAAVSKLYEDSSMASVGLGISSDNRYLVAPEASGVLLSLDLVSGLPARFDCGCAPDGAFSMGRSVFRFTGLRGAVFKVFDASTGDVFFVPLAASESSVAGGQQ